MRSCGAMLARRLKCRQYKRWEYLFQPLNHSNRLHHHDFSRFHSIVTNGNCSGGNFVKRYLIDSWLSLNENSNAHSWRRLQFYSSEGDGGRNASEDKHTHPIKDGVNFDKSANTQQSEHTAEVSIRQCDEHARLGEHDQKEWLNNEKLAIENKKKESPFLSRREKFKNEFLRRIIPWEKITVSWESFPYFVHEHTKNLLVECVASHFKHKKFASGYGSRLTSSSGRILLQSVPGTELYRERLVRALARDLKVPLLVLDSSVLAPYDFGEDCSSEVESDDEQAASSEECTSESEADDDNEEEWSNTETRSDATENDEIDVQASAEALKKLVPFNLDEFEKRVSGELESSSESKSEGVENETSDESQRPLRKGDRVKYIGPSVRVESDNRELATGQCGEVYEVDGDRVAVILDKGQTDESVEQDAKPPIYWIPVKDIQHDRDAQAEECYIAMEALCEVLQSKQPLIVYFPDSSLWLSRASPKSNRKEFVNKVQEMFEQLSGPLVLICGQNKVETGSKEKERFTMILPNFGRLAKLPLPLRRLTEGLKATKRSDDTDICKLFTNVMSIHPPKADTI